MGAGVASVLLTCCISLLTDTSYHSHPSLLLSLLISELRPTRFCTCVYPLLSLYY